MSKKRIYNVVGFDILNESFMEPTGAMLDKETYVVKPVNNEIQAVTALLTDPDINEMSYTNTFDTYTANQLTDIQLRITFRNNGNMKMNQSIEKLITASVMSWAEKSRVRNCRGFRSYAIKTPIIEKISNRIIDYTYKTDLLLGRTIIYDAYDKVMKSHESFTDLNNDIKLLKQDIIKRLGTYWRYIDDIYYSNSIYGRHSVMR